MPNRVIRDWTDSYRINQLSSKEERFFVRLMMKADDYGLFTADVKLLRANLFPLLLEEVREADISRWIAACVKAGLIRLYTSAGKRYLEIKNFGQRLDKARPKHPLPPSEKDGNDFPEPGNDFPAESETETETEVESEKKSKRPRKKQILFRDSEIFDKKIFSAALENSDYAAADVDYYHEIALNWSDSKANRKVDWLATLKNWMRRDMNEGKFITKNQNGNNQGTFNQRPTTGGAKAGRGGTIEDLQALKRRPKGPADAGPGSGGLQDHPGGADWTPAEVIE